MANSVIYGMAEPLAPSSAYRFLGFGTNSASDTTWTDLSGRGNHATLGANLAAATAWATAGLNITTEQSVAATTVPIFALPTGAWDWTGSDSFLIFARGQFVTPGATSAMLGASGSVAAKPGIRMRTFTTAKTDLSFTNDAGTVTTVTATSGNLSEASPSVDSTAAWVYDATTRTASIYVNGAIDVSGYAVPAANYTNVGNPFYIGGAPSGSTNFVSTACRFRELHMLVRTGRGVPSNITTLVEKLQQHRFIALTASEF